MLVSNWRQVLKRAWSVRLLVVAAALSGLEVALPILPFAIAPGIFAALTAFTTAAALVARVMAQKSISEVHHEN